MTFREAGGISLAPARAVGELARLLGGRADPAVEQRVVARMVSPADAADQSDLVIVTSRAAVPKARNAPGVILCDAGLTAQVPSGRRWSHPHCWWVVAKLLQPHEMSARQAMSSSDAAPTIHATAQIGFNVVVHSGAKIGARSVIGDHAVIFPRVSIGGGVVVGPLSVIGRPGFGWAAGPDGERVRIPQLGGVVIEDDAEIGPLCTIDAGTLGPTRIGRQSKLDAQVHVGHNVLIGQRTLIAAQSGIAGSAVLGDDVLVGGQVGVADHVVVGDGARLAAKSGVIGDIPAGAVVAGYPAVARARWLRGMARLLRRAPAVRKEAR